jgi:two-component system response regulator YesN
VYKLIIVDDEGIIRRGLRDVIPWAELGFTVIATASSAEEALKILSENTVDVLLTDIRMSGMTGLELIKEAREQHPTIRTVIISGYNDFDYAVNALKFKVEDYILKPLKPAKIRETFQQLRDTLDKERRRYLHPAADFSDKLKAEMEAEAPHRETIDALAREAQSSLDGRELCRAVFRDIAKHFQIPEWQPEAMDNITDIREALEKAMESFVATLRSHTKASGSFLVEEALKIIKKEYADMNISQSSVAERLSISPGYLSAIFVKFEGINFVSRLFQVRMERARELLLQRKYKIYEIATMTGYSDSRYFTDRFKKFYGKNPHEYLVGIGGKSDDI